MTVKIINKSTNPLPKYETPQSAGMDLRANNDDMIIIAPFKRALIPTGLYISLPVGYEAQIRARSGLALKNGIMLANGVGTIDSDYRGEIKIILFNSEDEYFVVRKGDKIAQMIITKHDNIEWSVTDSLDDTERGIGGFGHTGK